jgi:hypothetical protein
LLQFQASGYDSSNAFVLPVGKRTLIKAKPATTTRILSKKQRKKLEKVVDKKKKKTERGELIEKLMSVQVTVFTFFVTHLKAKIEKLYSRGSIFPHTPALIWISFINKKKRKYKS